MAEAATKETKEPVKTPEQIAAEKKEAEGKKPVGNAAIEFLKRSIAKVPKEGEKEKKGKETPDPDKKTDDTKGADKGKEKTKETKKAAPAAAKTATVVDVKAIATEAAAAGAKAAVAEITKTKEKETEKKQKEEDPLASDPEATKTISKLKLLEEVHGERYKGIEQRFRKADADWQKYGAEWKRRNPGAEFDPDDREHEAKRAELEATYEYDEDDLIEAIADKRAEQKAEKKVSKAIAPIQGKLDEIERERNAVKEQPKIDAAANGASTHFVNTLGGEFKEFLDDKGLFDQKKLDEIKDTEPDVYDEISAALSVIKKDSAMIYRIFNNLEAYNPKENEDHLRLYHANHGLEQEMLQQSVEDRTDDKGRLFATAAAYGEMTKEERSKHWTFTDNHLIYIFSGRIAQQARKVIEEKEKSFERYAKSRGMEYKSRTRKPAGSKSDNGEETPENTDDDDSTPTVRSMTPRAASTIKVSADPNENLKTFLNRGKGKM